MAGPENKGKRGLAEPLVRTKNAQRYFFLDGSLYKMMRQNRASDLLSAWSYDDDAIRHFVLSDVKKVMKNAYSTQEVARLLNRTGRTVQQYVIDGGIKEPRRIATSGLNKYGHPFTHMKWSEEDILALHDYLLTMGPLRKDGLGHRSPVNLPTRKELQAAMRQQPMFYMQTSDGEFVPVWQAKDHF